MGYLFRQPWISMLRLLRNSKLKTLVAVSCALCLFLHTQGRLNYDIDDVAEAINYVKHQILEDTRVPAPWELNNTARANVNLLFFNRVPKVGSHTMMKLLSELSLINKFGFVTEPLKSFQRIFLDPASQLEFVNFLSAIRLPTSYVEHIGYTNFTKYGYPTPIYMNMVRDPVERVISWYYYIRSPAYVAWSKRWFPELPPPHPVWLNMDYETCVLSNNSECRYVTDEQTYADRLGQSVFFCGQEPECISFNSLEVIQRAKRVVEQHYAVVGVLEDLNSTLLALERYIPRFFRGASRLYWANSTMIISHRNRRKPMVSEAVKQIVRANFSREIEFYEFCKQRLYMQLKALRDPTITLPESRRVKRRTMKQSRRILKRKT